MCCFIAVNDLGCKTIGIRWDGGDLACLSREAYDALSSISNNYTMVQRHAHFGYQWNQRKN